MKHTLPVNRVVVNYSIIQTKVVITLYTNFSLCMYYNTYSYLSICGCTLTGFNTLISRQASILLLSRLRIVRFSVTKFNSV